MINFLSRFILILIILVSGCINYTLYAQNDDKIYNHYTDTLIVLEDLVVDKAKILVNREDILVIDSLTVNQKGFKVIEFKMNVLALGANILLESNSCVLTTEMKNEIVNEQTKYKFIYLKDILLQGGDGKKYYPSTKSIKIVFKN